MFGAVQLYVTADSLYTIMSQIHKIQNGRHRGFRYVTDGVVGMMQRVADIRAKTIGS